MKDISHILLAVLLSLLLVSCHKYPVGPTNPSGINYNSTAYPSRVNVYVHNSQTGFIGKTAYCKLMQQGKDPVADTAFGAAQAVITDETVYVQKEGENFFIANLAISPQAIPLGVYDIYVIVDRDFSGPGLATIGDLTYSAMGVTINSELDHDVFSATLYETGIYPTITIDGNGAEWPGLDSNYWTLKSGEVNGDLGEATDGHWDPLSAATTVMNQEYDDLASLRAVWDADNLYLYIEGVDKSDWMRTLVLIDWDSLAFIGVNADGDDVSIYTGESDWNVSNRMPGGAINPIPRGQHRFKLWDEALVPIAASPTGYASMGVDYYIPLTEKSGAAPVTQMEAWYIEYSGEIQPPGNGKVSQRSDTSVNPLFWPEVAKGAGVTAVTEIKIPFAGFAGSFTSQPGGTLRLAVVTAAYNWKNGADQCRGVYDVIPNCLYPTEGVREDNLGTMNDNVKVDQYLVLEIDANADGVPDSFW